MVRRKQLSNTLTLISTSHFPYNTDRRNSGAHRALLGIGGNIGDTLRRFEHLFWVLQRSRLLEIIECSPILRNPPFGYTEQEDFYNALILVSTKLPPKALLRYILRVEKRFGRKRTFQDAPRTLDIDMIYYEGVRMETERLNLPHPGHLSRASVQIPLGYMREKIENTGMR